MLADALEVSKNAGPNPRSHHSVASPTVTVVSDHGGRPLLASLRGDTI
jgi:hypothetical protein